MCGIAGWFGDVPDAECVARCLAGALRHRGPDAQGTRQWPGAGLVHTRLSIIDLSPAGAQPMGNEDQTIWVILNGEIYNHRALRRQLEARGHRLEGHADTAVLPHLYEEYGPDCVEHLRGMFALVVYDAVADRLVLARDRFGIKPLFYTTDPARLFFASELQALRALPGVDTRPDQQAIGDFAALHYVPAPDTFYRGIRALQPGELIVTGRANGSVVRHPRRYHCWSIAPDLDLTRAHAAEQAHALLGTAVSSQLESDVPLGSLLSGGIDSSLVSAAAQTGRRGLKTFNVRFPDREYDETWAAVAVADHIGSRHATLEMDSVPGTWEHVVGLLRHAGQPFADTSLFAVNAVCALMRRHVTVALSGDGGDEGFGGYDTFWRLSRIGRLQRFPLMLRAGATMLQPFTRWPGVPSQVPRRARELAGADGTTVVQSLLSALPASTHRALCRELRVASPRRLFEPQWPVHLPRRVSAVEALSAHATEVHFRLTLPNDFLFKVDLASMREGLEVRVPMLDEDLVKLGLTLPHSLKVRGAVGKIVLRDVAARQLPSRVTRKPKAGFAIPVDRWVDGDFRGQLRHEVLERASPLRDIFQPEIYQPWVEAFCAGRLVDGMSRSGLYRNVIMLLALHVALDQT